MDESSNGNGIDGWLAAPAQRTLSDYVADQLRQAILTDKIKPGQRLVEQDLAEGMQTSRGPVRDALKILETEGLVDRQSHKGAFVAELSTKDVQEIYTLRSALEKLAMRYVIRNASDAQIDELGKIVQEMEQMAQRDYNQVEATDLDMKFHYTLLRITGHKRLLNAWVALSAQIRLVLLKHRLWNPKDHRERSVSWHARMVEALRRRDPEQAIKELQMHVAASTEWLHEGIEF